MRKTLLASAAALATAPFVALPAFASSCVSGGSVASYVALGATGCSVDGVTFTNIAVTPTVTGGGSASVTTFTTFSLGPEVGLILNYSANTGFGGTADVSWTYDVSGSLLTDAIAEFTGNAPPVNTTENLVETLTNTAGTVVASIDLTSPNTSETVTFAAVGSLQAVKDQDDFSAGVNNASTSSMENGFSLTTTPIPGTLPLFASGLVGFWAWSRKRKGNAQLPSPSA
jgi:hypothetical protein